MKQAFMSVLACICLLMCAAGVRAQEHESQDRFIFRDGDLIGYLDQNGIPVIKAQFEEGREFHDGMALVYVTIKLNGVKKTQPCYIDKDGKILIRLPPETPCMPFYDGLAMIGRDGKWQYIDKTGQVVIEALPQWEKLTNFSDGMARVKINGRYNFIDKTGKMLLGTPVDEATDFSGGLARVKIPNHWGYINTEGKYVWLSK